MRFTRAGKSTHQRVPQESTSWDELKSTPAKSKDSAKKGNFNRQNRQGQRDGKGGGNRYEKGNRNNFGKNRRQEEESANFVELGDRTKPNGGEKKNVMGYGKSKQVKICGQFWVASEDAKRLQALAKKLKTEGMSKKEIWDALQNERRKAEKSARRARDKTCFNCRQFGHVLFDCPNTKSGKGDPSEGGADTTNQIGAEICFKCGSTEHSSRHCKKSADKFDFAKCFICSKTGHIARQCPENKKGIYPSGGCCNECGESTHLAKDCPTLAPVEKGAHIDTGDDAVTGRIVNPFVSPEYEDIPAKDSVKVSNHKRFNEADTSKPKDSEPLAKKRRVKF